MDFKALFESLPEILALFVPGFIFIKTYCFFIKANSDSFESTAVASITISYVLNLIVDLYLVISFKAALKSVISESSESLTRLAINLK